jgi:hypothetical protein
MVGESTIMRLTRTIVTSILLVVIVAGLGSLAYPIVPVPLVSTETISGASTYTEYYSTTLLGTLVTTVQVPYSTATAWVLTAYPLCDPASMACPGPPLAVVTTISGNSVWFYQVASTSQWSETFSAEYSVQSAHTTIQNVPIYSAEGLSSAQFVQLVIAIILVGILGLLLTHEPSKTLREEKPRSGKYRCAKCGADYLWSDSKFCLRCGAPRDS